MSVWSLSAGAVGPWLWMLRRNWAQVLWESSSYPQRLTHFSRPYIIELPNSSAKHLDNFTISPHSSFLTLGIFFPVTAVGMKLYLILVLICIFHHLLSIFFGEFSIQLLCFKTVLFKPLYQYWGIKPRQTSASNRSPSDGIFASYIGVVYGLVINLH